MGGPAAWLLGAQVPFAHRHTAPGPLVSGGGALLPCDHRSWLASLTQIELSDYQP